MTVRVLAPPENLLQVKCSGCFCKLGYVPKDVTKMVIGDYSGDSEIVYSIVCPDCRSEVRVSQP